MPWRTQRFDDATIRCTYGTPQSDAHSYEMTLIDRDAAGVLLRHATGRYTHKHGKGQLVSACLSSSASELVTLVKFTNLHEPQMRIQLLRLRSHEWGWLPLKIGFATTDRSRQPALLAIGPYMDSQATDHVYVLIDHVVRIFSLGSGVQVHVAAPSLAGSAHLNSLAVAGDGRRFAVGCSPSAANDNDSGLWIYESQPPQGRLKSQLINVRMGSARAGMNRPEQRVRDGYFYLGRDHAEILSEHSNIYEYICHITNNMVDTAVVTQSSMETDTNEGVHKRGVGGLGAEVKDADIRELAETYADAGLIDEAADTNALGAHETGSQSSDQHPT